MPEKTRKTFRRLSHQDRLDIEKGITYGRSFSSIAKSIGVSTSTISREVLRNRVRDRSTRYGKGIRRFCANEKDCTVRRLCDSGCEKLCRVCTESLCTIRCPYHEAATCQRLTGVPYSCNGCSKKATCFVERYVYDAAQATHAAYLYVDDDDIDDDNDEPIRVYCADPRRPQQRGCLEKNHTYIREILPKGSSFDELTDADVRLMASHINSIPRTSLGGKTPYEVAGFLYTDELCERLGISRIDADEVIRRPWLIGEPPPWAFDRESADGKI